MYVSTRTSLLIHRRAGGRCELDGLFIDSGEGQRSHRQPKGQGGSTDPANDSPENFLYVHPRCHARIESNRTEAEDNGWLVRHGFDPLLVPARLWDGWYFLGPGGEARPRGQGA